MNIFFTLPSFIPLVCQCLTNTVCPAAQRYYMPLVLGELTVCYAGYDSINCYAVFCVYMRNWMESAHEHDEHVIVSMEPL